LSWWVGGREPKGLTKNLGPRGGVGEYTKKRETKGRRKKGVGRAGNQFVKNK